MGFFVFISLRKPQNSMIHFFLRSLLLLSLFYPLSAQETFGSFSKEKLKAFEDFLGEEINSQKLAGVEVLIFQNDAVVWHSVKGYQNLEEKTPLKKNSLYYIQSMTKPIISLAIMQLVDQGLIALDDPVAKYIPEASNLRITKDPQKGKNGPSVPAQKALQIKHLLTHTAGLSHGLENTLLDKELFQALYGETLDYTLHDSIESRVASLLEFPLIGPVGAQWHYSASPDLLALIVQRVSQQSVPSYLKQHIFDPLGMKDTGYNLSDSQAKRMMQLHVVGADGNIQLSPEQVPTMGNTVYGGTHGLFSTPIEYARFCQLFLNQGKIGNQSLLSPEMALKMRTNKVGELLGYSRGFGYGFGVLKENIPPMNKGQFYWNGYFSTHFIVDPEENFTAILMTQKFPYSQEYAEQLNKWIYAALE